jgi:hypothetical protein
MAGERGRTQQAAHEAAKGELTMAIPRIQIDKPIRTVADLAAVLREAGHEAQAAQVAACATTVANYDKVAPLRYRKNLPAEVVGTYCHVTEVVYSVTWWRVVPLSCGPVLYCYGSLEATSGNFIEGTETEWEKVFWGLDGWAKIACNGRYGF